MTPSVLSTPGGAPATRQRIDGRPRPGPPVRAQRAPAHRWGAPEWVGQGHQERGPRAGARPHQGPPRQCRGGPTCRGRVARAPQEAAGAGNRDAPGRARPPDHARNRERPRNIGDALWHYFHFMHMVPKIEKTENEDRRLAGTCVLDYLCPRASALLAPTRDRWGMPMIQGTWANRVRLGSKPRVDLALPWRKGAFSNLLSCCHLLQISRHPSVELCVCEVCRCLAVGIA